MSNSQGMAMKNIRNGGCACGACRFSLVGEPNSCYACHCDECQTRSGSVCTLAVVVSDGSLSITQGDPASIVVGKRKHRYCAVCGSALFNDNADQPGVLFITGGLFDKTDWLKPCAHPWTPTAQPWITLPTDVPNYQTQPENLSGILELWPA